MRLVNTSKTGSDSSPEPDMLLTIEIPARVDCVALARMVVAAAANAAGVLDGDRLDDLRLVVSEATTNAIEANIDAIYDPGSSEMVGQTLPPGSVVIECDMSDERVKLEVTDIGDGVSEPAPLPEITDPDRLFIEGGFGIPLIEHFSSVLHFNSIRTGTTVIIEMRQT